MAGSVPYTAFLPHSQSVFRSLRVGGYTWSYRLESALTRLSVGRSSRRSNPLTTPLCSRFVGAWRAEYPESQYGAAVQVPPQPDTPRCEYISILLGVDRPGFSGDPSLSGVGGSAFSRRSATSRSWASEEIAAPGKSSRSRCARVTSRQEGGRRVSGANPSARRPARVRAEEPADRTEARPTGATGGSEGRAPTGRAELVCGGGGGVVAVAGACYILHLRESNPPKPGNGSQRRSAGGSR